MICGANPSQQFFLIVDIFYVKLMSPSHFKFQILCYSHAPDNKCASYMRRPFHPVKCRGLRDETTTHSDMLHFECPFFHPI